MKDGSQAGILDFLETDEVYIPVYPLLSTMHHGMYIISKLCSADQIELFAHMALVSGMVEPCRMEILRKSV